MGYEAEGYDFEIHFKLGRENMVADALSRVDIPLMLVLSYPTTTWLQELRTYFTNNQVGMESV